MSLFYRWSFFLLLLLVCHVDCAAWRAPNIEPLVGDDGPYDNQQRLRLRVLSTYTWTNEETEIRTLEHKA